MPYKYDKEDKFLVTVDCVLFGYEQETLKVLLTGRNQEERRKWSLAGGFLKKNETLDGAVSRVLYHLTGKQDVFMEQLYAAFDQQKIKSWPEAHLLNRLLFSKYEK